VTIPSQQGSAIVFEDGDVKVTAFNVNHHPVSPAYGYRVDYGDRSVVVSGDTTKDPRVVRAATGADVLVHEALSKRMVGAGRDAAEAAGLERRRRILGDILDYHTSPEEAAEVAKQADVGLLVLNHLVPPLDNAAAEFLFLSGVADAWDGDVLLGELGMQSWALDRSKPLPVYGPPGVGEVVAGFERAYAQDSAYRTAHHGADLMPPANRPLLARPVTIPSQQGSAIVFEDGDVKVTAFNVNHHPVSPAYGYRECSSAPSPPSTAPNGSSWHRSRRCAIPIASTRSI
jgi:ribonuclease BN (tRNA processing enzyme)